MLAPGLTAHPLPRAEQLLLYRYQPGARAAVRLLHGACSCDLVRERGASRDDDTELRRRYFQRGLPRDRVIRAVESHREALRLPPAAPGHWPRAARAFVAEHARNAGPALYYLHFSDSALSTEPPDPDTALTLPTGALGEVPTGPWLPEDRLVVISR